MMGVVNRQASGYTCFVAEKKAAGLGTPKYERRTTATWRYFFVRMPLCVYFNGRALAGTASAVPVSFVPVFQTCQVPALPFGTGKRINATKETCMKNATHFPLDQKSASAALSPAAADPQPVRALAAHLEMIEANVQRARDMVCLFAYLTQEVPDSSKHIELDRQALRGVMERICGDLDEALRSMDQTSDLFSLIANKSTT